MYKLIIFLLFLFGIIVFIIWSRRPTLLPFSPLPSTQPYWSIRSIDTMKYSRDFAREKAGDPDFDTTIDTQVKNIAGTGATHIALDAPYDEEFIPYLTRWVTAARKYHLHVWFRGNFSGWEQWFGYAKITRAEHLLLTKQFILNYPSLFEDGDLFASCPECENGGPGDPRETGDIEGHRQFLIDEYHAASDAFQTIHRSVAADYNSMNYDVAMVVMDPETTKALGNIVVVDHYVKTSDKLISDLTDLKNFSGGQVFLGEFGAPIPDIHGDMTDDEQSDWLHQTLEALVQSKVIFGFNYWVGVGGSTELWHDDGTAKPAVNVLSSYFSHQ